MCSNAKKGNQKSYVLLEHLYLAANPKL